MLKVALNTITLTLSYIMTIFNVFLTNLWSQSEMIPYLVFVSMYHTLLQYQLHFLSYTTQGLVACDIATNIIYQYQLHFLSYTTRGLVACDIATNIIYQWLRDKPFFFFYNNLTLPKFIQRKTSIFVGCVAKKVKHTGQDVHTCK